METKKNKFLKWNSLEVCANSWAGIPRCLNTSRWKKRSKVLRRYLDEN